MVLVLRRFGSGLALPLYVSGRFLPFKEAPHITVTFRTAVFGAAAWPVEGARDTLNISPTYFKKDRRQLPFKIPLSLNTEE